RGPGGCQAISPAVRTVSVADHEEPPVQLSATRFQPVRGSVGAAQRDHLQRGQAQPAPSAARSARPTCRRCRPPGAHRGPVRRSQCGLARLDGARRGTRATERHAMNRKVIAGLAISCLCLLTGCGWKGLNTLRLPGTQGVGKDAYTIQAQLPDVVDIQPNTRVRVADVNIGNVTKIEVQDWHALVTMRI